MRGKTHIAACEDGRTIHVVLTMILHNVYFVSAAWDLVIKMFLWIYGGAK